MGPGLTLDTGALIAIEEATVKRVRSRLYLVLEAALRGRRRVTVPSAVVVEWWREQRGPAATILRGLTVEPLSHELARIAGAALAKCADGPSAIDAVVVASAAQRGDIVYTSDVDDLERVRDAAFPGVRILRI